MPAMLLYPTLGLALVLLLRKPARRLFGAGPAFTLWLLPPLLVMLPALPTLPSAWSITPMLQILPVMPSITAPAEATASTPDWLWPLWLAGAIAGLLRLAVHYGHLLRQGRPVPDTMQRQLQAALGGFDPHRLRLHPAGPAVLWAPRSLLLIPADFLECFDADERCLVLQHEFTHLRRGDALWSLLADIAGALLWFHPLAWLALPRLRLDQELACDERVLRQAPQDEAMYARALLRSTGMGTTPVLIPWLDEPQLKERLHMIQRHRPGALRRRIGFIALAALMAGGACVVSAATPHDRQPSPVATADLDYNLQRQPTYPASAIKNMEQGTVILDVLVGTDGKPLKLEVDPATKAAPDLVKAASEAAMEWRFNPAMKNGQPVESHARVPVAFNLKPLSETLPEKAKESSSNKN